MICREMLRGVRSLNVSNSIAKEAEAEAAKLMPAAETAIQSARQAVMTLRGQPQELTLPYLHDLAAARLRIWLSAQKDVSGFQVDPSADCPDRLHEYLQAA